MRFHHAMLRITRSPLLGALDIALYRQDDVRFQKFSSEAISQLTDAKFGQTEGIDIWALLTIFAGLVHNRINVLENGPNHPGYWKRLCAWMQAGVIVRILIGQSTMHDIHSLREWAHKSMTAEGQYAAFFDARREPMLLVPQTLQNEILDRLLILKARHEKEKREIPRLKDIHQALDQCRKNGQPFVANLPGLLEGHKRPNTLIPDNIAKEFGLQRVDNLELFPWPAAAAASQSFLLGEPKLKRARQAASLMTASATPSNLDEKLVSLNLASFVAIAHGDKVLANTVADVTVYLVENISKTDQLSIMFGILLRTATTYSKGRTWFESFGKRLADFADRIPNSQKDFLQLFLAHLSAIETVLPLGSWCHLRAKSIALAGIDLENLLQMPKEI